MRNQNRNQKIGEMIRLKHSSKEGRFVFQGRLMVGTVFSTAQKFTRGLRPLQQWTILETDVCRIGHMPVKSVGSMTWLGPDKNGLNQYAMKIWARNQRIFATEIDRENVPNLYRLELI